MGENNNPKQILLEKIKKELGSVSENLPKIGAVATTGIVMANPGFADKPVPALGVAGGVAAHYIGEQLVQTFELASQKVGDVPTAPDEKLIKFLSSESLEPMTRTLLRFAPALLLMSVVQPETLDLAQHIVMSMQGLEVGDILPLLHEMLTPINIIALSSLILSLPIHTAAITTSIRLHK